MPIKANYTFLQTLNSTIESYNGTKELIETLQRCDTSISISTLFGKERVIIKQLELEESGISELATSFIINELSLQNGKRLEFIKQHVDDFPYAV